MRKAGGWAALALLAGVALASLASYRFIVDGAGRPGALASGPLPASAAGLARQDAGDALGRLLAANHGTGVRDAAREPARVPDGSLGTYIVVMTDAPVAAYRGGIRGIPAPRLAKRGGTMRLDARSDGALKYARHLQQRQDRFERVASGMMGRRVGVRARMQHAISAVVMDLSAAEAARVRALPGVRFVEPYRTYPLHTDTSPTLIGAPSLWTNTSPFVPASYQGEGVVIGVIDSGINFGSPSFAAVDPIDGYTHMNPRGPGTYLGTCAVGGVDAGRCNAKLIGGHDFVCGAPSNMCGAANVREEPGFGDTHSHGTHVAGIAAGNRRDVVLSGRTYRISGVAPRANLIAYDACYTDTLTGRGVCPNSATVAAVNQAIVDGVDVINLSVGGGTQPWREATSLALLAAVDAGIYVAAPAGDNGSAANTASHAEPWVGTTASVQHGSSIPATRVSITGPAPVSSYLSALYVSEATDGGKLRVSLPGTTPLRVSPGIDTSNDGCNAYPANTFAGAIAVVRRGTCALSIKVINAASAGAVAVIIGNVSQGWYVPSVPGTTVPTFGADQVQTDIIRNFAHSVRPAVVTAGILAPQVRLPNTPDVVPYSSARGPSGPFAMVKPDLAAPGVDVLAPIAGTQLTGSEQAVGLMSGTSMASAHHAGAAALLRQAHPAWTPMEVRSALQMTATSALTLAETGGSPAQALAAGSGRIRLDRAVRAGLVLDEIGPKFMAADPLGGGEEWALNVPSLSHPDCWYGCTFIRTVRNATTSGMLWRASLWALDGSVSPALVWIPAGATQTFTITVAPGNRAPTSLGYVEGRVTLENRVTGGGVDVYRELRLPVAVAVRPERASAPKDVQAVPDGAGGYVLPLRLSNIGGKSMSWIHVTWGGGVVELATNPPPRTPFHAFTSTAFSDPAQADAGSQGQFVADDFVVTNPVSITRLEVHGYLPASSLGLAASATAFNWSLFRDADEDGLPDGSPLGGGAVWSRTITAPSPWLTFEGSKISLSLTGSGGAAVLAPGRYFLVMHTSSTFANRFAQYQGQASSGLPGVATLNVASNGSGSWVRDTTLPGVAMRVTYEVNCDAPWVTGVSPTSGFIDRGLTADMVGTVNAAGLAPGTHRGAVCFQVSDIAFSGRVGIPVSLTIP